MQCFFAGLLPLFAERFFKPKLEDLPLWSSGHPSELSDIWTIFLKETPLPFMNYDDLLLCSCYPQGTSLKAWCSSLKKQVSCISAGMATLLQCTVYIRPCFCFLRFLNASKIEPRYDTGWVQKFLLSLLSDKNSKQRPIFTTTEIQQAAWLLIGSLALSTIAVDSILNTCCCTGP